MRLAELVAGIHDGFDTGAAMADVAALCTHDRYQASAGIHAAAQYVARRAEEAGLAEVTVHAFPADGGRHWWSFRAPRSWTPLRARLTVGGTDLVSYPAHAYTLAAYSAPTPRGGAAVTVRRWSDVDGRAGDDLTGTLVVLDTPVAPATTIGRLMAAGATGMVADPLGGRPDRGPAQVGRLELPPGATMAGFSVTPAVLRRLLVAADAGTPASMEIVLDPAPVPMPVVTALLPGDGEGEILLSAHLCHPRPSANDNASGVAALLGAARVLVARGGTGRCGLRFLWGPEFTGTVAYLHDVV